MGNVNRVNIIIDQIQKLQREGLIPGSQKFAKKAKNK